MIETKNGELSATKTIPHTLRLGVEGLGHSNGHRLQQETSVGNRDYFVQKLQWQQSEI